MVLWPVWLADKPLSLAGDVVTLPYVVWKRDRESRRVEARTKDGVVASYTPFDQ